MFRSLSDVQKLNWYGRAVWMWSYCSYLISNIATDGFVPAHCLLLVMCGIKRQCQFGLLISLSFSCWECCVIYTSQHYMSTTFFIDVREFHFFIPGSLFFFFRQKFAFRQGNQWRLMSWDILIQIWDVSATLQYFCGWNQNKKHVDLSKPCNIPASKWHFSRFFQNILSCSSVPLQLSFQLQSIHRNCLAVHCLVHTVHGKVGQNAYLVALPDE